MGPFLLLPAIGAAAFLGFSRKGTRTSGARSIYLDHNATTPIDPRVREAMRVFLSCAEQPGNPSSAHRRGQAGHDVLEAARRKVATALGAEPLGVTFTSGGTEADTLAVVGGCTELRQEGRPCGLLTSRLEHPAVLVSAERLEEQGHGVTFIDIDGAGRIDPSHVAAALQRDPGIGMVSLATANHELGNLYDIASITAHARSVRPDVLVHTDAVQAFGKVPVHLERWGVDFISVSAHKIGGPAGIGALIHRADAKVAPVLCGGGQEHGRRPGTENLLGAHGFGVAAQFAGAECISRRDRVMPLRDRLRAGLLRSFGDRVQFGGDPDAHVGNTLCAMFQGCAGAKLMTELDLAGVAVSTGSACSVGRVKPSQTALAVGYDDEAARSVIRFSLSHRNSEADIDKVLTLLPSSVQRSRTA